MSGCRNNKYNPNSQYPDLIFTAYLNGTVVDYITSEFESNTANALLRGISLDSNPEHGFKDEDEIIEFLTNFNGDPTIVEPVKEHKEATYSSDEDMSDLTVLSSYTSQGGVRIQYDRMISKFKTNIVERALLKNGLLVNPEEVNENLYQYKLELLKSLYQYIEPEKELPNLDSEENFTRFVKFILKRVNDKRKHDDQKNWSNYIDDYTTLLYFDKLLEDEIDFIHIKPEYAISGTYGKDMYVNTGPFNYKDRFASWSETAGTEDYTSAFVKLLLDYFKDSNGRSITLARFQAVSGQVIRWAEDVTTPDVQELLYTGLDESVNLDDDQSPFSLLLDKFVSEAVATSEIKSAAIAINNNIFHNKNLDPKIKKIFANQFITSIRYSYMGYRLMYDMDSEEKGPNAFRFVSDLLESDLINRQVYSLQGVIKSRVYQLRNNPQLLEELIKKYDIEITSQKIVLNANNNSQVRLTEDKGWAAQPYTVKVTDSDGKYTFKVDRNSDSISVPANLISDGFIKSFIEDVTGYMLPMDFKQVWNSIHTDPNKRMWDSFSTVAFITLSASSKSTVDPSVNLYSNYQYLYRGEELKLYPYYHDFTPLADFYSIVLGTEYATVIKNAEGHNLPTSQLRTSIFDIKREIYRLLHAKDHITERSNLRMFNMNTKQWENISSTGREYVLSDNVIVQNPHAIGTVAVRADTNINDSVKGSTQMSPSEILQEAIGVDFYSNLFGKNAIVKNQRKRNQIGISDSSIWIQPIAYSDKRTHYLIEFKLHNINIEGKKLRDILQKITSFSPERGENIKLLERGMQKVRLSKYEKQALNLINRFSTALGWGMQKQDNESVLEYFIRASEKLKDFSITYGKNAESKLNELFGERADLYVSDYQVLDNGEIVFNITLANQLRTNSVQSEFKSRINREKLQFLRDLIDIGFVFDPNTNPSWRSIFKQMQVGHDDWFDPVDGSMKLYKAFDGNRPITIDWVNVNTIDLSKLKIELNPILEGFFYADSFLSGQVNDLIFGDVNGYKSKLKTYQLPNSDELFAWLEGKPVSDNFINTLFEDESSRLADMAKRTVMGGASKIYFAQGTKYGISSSMKLLVLKDIQAKVFNFIGHKDSKDAQDGGAFSHPIFAREQNASLVDRAVGNQKKKTFCNWLDHETGTAGELKFAEYTLTNEMRRLGCEVTDFSFENLYKLMSSINDRRISTIDFTRYYNPSNNDPNFSEEGQKTFNEEGENITFIQHLYRYNLDLLMHQKLLRIGQDSRGIFAEWQDYNEDGTQFKDTFGEILTHKEYLQSNTLYGLDQLFGGAYCEIFDKNLGKFVWSEANLDLLHTIVAEEKLKDDFIALAVNSSAIKTGARNVNDPEILKYGNTSVPKWFEVSTLHYGIQMNPDHEIEDTRGVREMTQMISALVQNGYLMGDVNEIYQMIGSVALDSVKSVIDAVDANDEDKIYQIIGEALVKAFDTNQKDVLGLAQSFVAIANQDLANGTYKTRIPFSANTIKGSFQATITSFLNKDAIRRRFAGLGAIQTPSFGGVQYFMLNGYRLNWVEFCKELNGRKAAEYAVTDYTWNGFSFNNKYIVKVNPIDLKLNDTVVYRENGQTFVEKINDPTILYKFKYNNPAERQLYNWTVRPRDFSGSEILFSVNKQQFSIYDTDYVRIIDDLSNIASEIKKLRKLGLNGLVSTSYFKVERRTILIGEKEIVTEDLVPTEKGVQLLNMIANQFGVTYRDLQNSLGIDLQENPYIKYQLEQEGEPLRLIDSNIFKDEDLLERIFLLAKWRINNELLPILSKIKKGELTKLKVQEAYRQFVTPDENDEFEINVDELHTLQVGLGKLSAQKLGLQPGDTLNDVLKQKQNFFRKRLRRFSELPMEIDSDFYDAVLYEANGTPTLVMFGGLDRNIDRLDKVSSNNNFKIRGSNYWKNGIDFGSTTGKYFREYIDETGKSWNVVVVDDWKAFDELKNNGQYVNDIFNFTSKNYQDLVKYRYRYNFKDGKLVKQIGRDLLGRGFVEQMEDGTLYPVDNLNFIKNLNNAEAQRQKQSIDAEANKKWESFQMQLQIIIDRIPSQSMQSFTSADVVMLLDTEENAVVMSAFLAWLQGSDFDIDKGFIMAYEIGDDGKLITPSKLDKYYKATDIFELPLPNKKVFKFSTLSELKNELQDNSTFISIDEIQNGRIPIELLRRILLGSENVVFDDAFDTSEYIDIKNRIIDRINLHQKSANLPTALKTAGYRNRIVYKINKMLRDPITQGNLNLPVDEAMAELKKSIPTPEYRTELYRTWDNPATKYRIQFDNMVGRDVIGISAVSLKGFFALTTYANNKVLNIVNLIQQYKADLLNSKKHNVTLGNQIVQELQKICFDAKFIKDPLVKSGIATISNLRFTNLLSEVRNLPEIQYSIGLDTNRLTTLKVYTAKDEFNNEKMDEFGKFLNLQRLISDLDIYANGVYSNPKDANMVLSGYTSLATDNAKELALAKMNATSQFADLHTYAVITGTRPKDVISFMASPAFNIIRRFAEKNILDPNTKFLDTQKALNFILDRETHPVINNYVFKKILSTYDESESGKSLFNRQIGFSDDQLYYIYKEAKRKFENYNQTNYSKDDITDIRSAIDDMCSINSDVIVDAIYNLLLADYSAEEVLLKVFKYAFDSVEETSFNQNEIDPEELYESQFYDDAEEDIYDEEDSFYDADQYFNVGEISKSDWRQAYSYVKNYLIPKNKALNRLGFSKSLDNVIYNQYLNIEKVMYAAKEQQMLGTILGVNGGLDTGDHDEYKNVRKVERFVNDRYITYLQSNPTIQNDPSTRFVPFNFVDFLDKNKEEYRKQQIKQYEQVASTVNILDVIITVPHFYAMLQMIPLNRKLIQRSIALKMERELAEKVVHADKPDLVPGFNRGDKKALTQQEWAVLRNYVNDLLILKWFQQQTDLRINLPLNAKYYSGGLPLTNSVNTGITTESEKLRDSKSLSKLDGLATFKNLMDNYIIPDLKKAFPNNAFLQDILLGRMHNKELDRLQTFYRLSFNVSEASKNTGTKLKYEQVSMAFNEIAKKYLPIDLEQKYGRWKIGDLFFLYNLYVHKDGFSSQAFTRLFEDSTTTTNTFAFNKQYYDYLSKLDSGEIDYRELFAAELGYTSNPNSNTANDYLNDLRIRLANFPSSDWYFNIKAEGQGESYSLTLYDSEGNDRKFITLFNANINPSDYTLWFPYRILNSNLALFKVEARKELGLKHDRNLKDMDTNAVSSTVMKTLINKINETARIRTGEDLIKIIREEDLQKMRESGQGPIYFSSDDDFERTAKAKAFIYNGRIYVNLQEAKIDDPIHEFLHIVLAGMKGNPNNQIRQKYYALVNAVVQQEPQLYQDMKNLYGNRWDSDIKEEVFVRYLANGFAAKFNEKLNTEIGNTILKESDLINFTISAINSLFGSEVPIDIEAVPLGNTSVRDIFGLFGNDLLNMQKSSFAEMYLSRDEAIRNIKEFLFSKKDMNNTINYGKGCL